MAYDAARGVIERAELGRCFTHRTGHNIGQDLHGSGANLDNLETHDVRQVVQGVTGQDLGDLALAVVSRPGHGILTLFGPGSELFRHSSLRLLRVGCL